MKKEISVLKIRWKCRKQVIYTSFVLVSSLMLSTIFDIKFAIFTDTNKWKESSLYSIAIFLFFCIIIYVIIFIKSKKIVYYIKIEEKKCIRNKKIFYYTNCFYSQTIIQKIMGIVDIELYNNIACKFIKIRDVSSNVLYYIDASPKGK